MTEVNQYQAPKSQVEQGGVEQYSTPKVFGVNGRIGRLRFIAYSVLATILMMFVVGLLSAIAPQVAAPLVIVGYLALLIYTFMISIQRSHDMNLSGWFSIIVVLFGIIFWFIPGTKGDNNYGNVPKPNHAGIYIAAFLVPVIYIGILAAVAIPAYQGYVQKAQENQQQFEQQR